MQTHTNAHTHAHTRTHIYAQTSSTLVSSANLNHSTWARQFRCDGCPNRNTQHSQAGAQTSNCAWLNMAETCLRHCMVGLVFDRVACHARNAAQPISTSVPLQPEVPFLSPALTPGVLDDPVVRVQVRACVCIYVFNLQVYKCMFSVRACVYTCMQLCACICET